ncbi:hypothetical protein [Catellatospora chokoriensis]|nr:hypothetical protein [Catellatospora chokoriensis]
MTYSGDAPLDDGWIGFQVTPDLFTGEVAPRDLVKMTPRLSWSVDGGTWHPVQLDDWRPATLPNHLSYWVTDDYAFPGLAANSRHSVRLRISFREGNPRGYYYVNAGIGGRCTDAGETRFLFGYDPKLLRLDGKQAGNSAKATASPPATPSGSTSPRTAATSASASAPVTRRADHSAAGGGNLRNWLIAGAAAAAAVLAAFAAGKAIRARRMIG